jgi:ketosteroid isomerase-like protein
MKFVFALLLLAAPAFAADTDSKAEKEVAAAIETWKHAMVKGDAGSLEKLYHKDLVYTHSSAKNETKSEAIAAATKPDGIAKSIDLHDTVIHVYGNTAVVKTLGDFANQSGPVNHLNVLMVWLKSPQGWQLVARQATKLP